MEKCEHVFKRVNKSNYKSNDIRNFTGIFICGVVMCFCLRIISFLSCVCVCFSKKKKKVIIYNQCTIKKYC